MLNDADRAMNREIQDGDPLEDDMLLTRRMQAGQNLLQMCPRTWVPKGKLLYWLRIGAASSTKHAAGLEIYGELKIGWIHPAPCIPAVNRWSKVATI